VEIVIGAIEADEFHRWKRGAEAVRAVAAVVSDFADGRIYPVIKVQVRTRAELAGKVGRVRLGVDAWCRPNDFLHVLTVHDSFQDPL
jgi:type VI secretion system protein ImpH